MRVCSGRVSDVTAAAATAAGDIVVVVVVVVVADDVAVSVTAVGRGDS